MDDKKVDNNLYDYVFPTIEKNKKTAKYVLKNMFADFVDKDDFMEKFELESLDEVKKFIFSGEHSFDLVMYGSRQYERYHSDFVKFDSYYNNAIKYSRKTRRKTDY